MSDLISKAAAIQAVFDWEQGKISGTIADAIAAIPATDARGDELTVWYGPMPESNGRQNWTAMLYRKGSKDRFLEGYCFDRSEYPDRVRYAADRMRWVIGERPERPDILAYDDKLHSGYVEPTSATAARADALREAAAISEFEDDKYLILKRGMYYRPDRKGYTNSPSEAGRYTLAQAVFLTHPNGPDGPRDGMSFVPLSALIKDAKP